METLLTSTQTFSTLGRYLMMALTGILGLIAILAATNLVYARPQGARAGRVLLVVTAFATVGGFLLICWFHYQIYRNLPLELPPSLVDFVNQQLAAMNKRTAYSLPLFNPSAPPRYAIPVWIENEKYFFWFMVYALMALTASIKLDHPRIEALAHLLLAIHGVLIVAFADPFAHPLPRFFEEINAWHNAGLAPMTQAGIFLRLYSKMIFYYNASYMWMHPPLLFGAYACMTLTFVASLFMLGKREPALEALGYDYAKLGYFLLTVGMLLGYPWALKAWGPNWWWDPKICSSIMMWALYTTYLHTRLYAYRPAMWYFSSMLGILCFLAMLFTFLTSFLFPGEHTFQ